MFENNNGEIIYLDISLKENVLIKKKDNLIEYVKIDNNLLLVHEIIEKRPSGIVYSINLGLLTPDSYNLKALRGITDKEDSIVGKSLINEDEEYLKYLKGMLYKRIGFKGNLELNRDSILSAITYKMSSSELVKRQIEERLGISY